VVLELALLLLLLLLAPTVVLAPEVAVVTLPPVALCVTALVFPVVDVNAPEVDDWSASLSGSDEQPNHRLPNNGANASTDLILNGIIVGFVLGRLSPRQLQFAQCNALVMALWSVEC